MIGDTTYAEDIVQEAAVIAFEKSGEFATGSHFGAWLAEIVRRCALNYRRKMGNRKTRPADPRGLASVESHLATRNMVLPFSPESGTLSESQTAFDDNVVRALWQLSDDSRCCLLLRTVLDLSYAEISELMGIPEGTAMSHVHRSKLKMRTQLSNYAPSRPTSDQTKPHGTT